MKKTIYKSTLLFALVAMLSSCYSYTSVVGTGAQGTTQTTKWNHYLLGGLIPIEVSDSKEMAGGASNYTIFTRHTFINGLIQGVTFGIYTPTTTTVTK